MGAWWQEKGWTYDEWRHWHDDMPVCDCPGCMRAAHRQTVPFNSKAPQLCDPCFEGHCVHCKNLPALMSAYRPRRADGKRYTMGDINPAPLEQVK